MQVGPSLGPTLGLVLGPTLDELDAARGIAAARRPTETSADRTGTFTIKLGTWMYPLAWAGIYLLHAACAAYYFTAGMLFHRYQTMRTAYYLDFYQVTLLSKYAGKVALGHYIIGGVHCWLLFMAAIRMVFRIGHRIVRRCKQRRTSAVQPSHRTSNSFLDRVAAVGSQTLTQHMPMLLQKPLRTVYTHIFGRRGLLGVEYRYFDTFFLVREICETALQSLQAYHMCRQLARPALNRFFVATLVVNCWATPVLHHVVASRPMQRLITRLCDVVLDFLASVGVPVILFMDYISDFDPVTKDFPYRLWYDDMWFVNALKESPIILFSSWIDAVSRLVFSIGVLSSLDDIKMLLKRGRGIEVSKAIASLRRISTARLSGKKPRPSRVMAHSPRKKPHRSRVTMVAHRLMFLYGVLILGVHLYAELRPSPMSSCLLAVRPWLVTRPACSLVEVNCWSDRTLTGSASDFADNVGELDALSLTQVTFRHCRQIEIQATIEQFRNLIGIKFYNSTIVTWGEDAALREAHHANMRFAFFVRTVLPNATLPPGMISHEFPLYLNDLEFSVTNINWIPDDLDKRWPPGVALCLEFSELTTYPLTFARAQFQSLTLAGNKITSLPADAFEALGPFMIGVTGNPLTALPADVNASLVTLRRFAIDSTNVSSVPPWVREWIEQRPAKRSVTAGRTPWCRDVVLQLPASEIAAQPWLSRFNCKDNGPTFGVYPLYVDERTAEVW